MRIITKLLLPCSTKESCATCSQLTGCLSGDAAGPRGHPSCSLLPSGNALKLALPCPSRKEASSGQATERAPRERQQAGSPPVNKEQIQFGWDLGAPMQLRNKRQAQSQAHATSGLLRVGRRLPLSTYTLPLGGVPKLCTGAELGMLSAGWHIYGG